MPISHREAERAVDAAFADRRIGSHVYCAKCGYNLRTLSYVGRCPECGNDYNARPLRLIGIFDPRTAAFPLSDVFGAMVTTTMAVMLLISGFRNQYEWAVLFGLLIGVLAPFYVRIAIKKLALYFHALGVVRRVQADMEADD